MATVPLTCIRSSIIPTRCGCCKLIEDLEPYLVEDPTRDEQFLEDIPRLRQMTTVPIAAGEEWGQRWNFNKLVENHDIDYNRCTLPNVGGVTEYLKIMAMCETHAVGMVPHFTGPIATAALVNCLATFPGPVLFEYNYGNRPVDYLPEFVDFQQGKLYPNERVGLGVTLEPELLKQISEVTNRGRCTRCTIGRTDRLRIGRFNRAAIVSLLYMGRATGWYILVLSLALHAQVQAPAFNSNAAAAYESLLRLRTTATVLHTTAHPDDEDGALITWLARSQGVRTGLFTVNRGEGARI